MPADRPQKTEAASMMKVQTYEAAFGWINSTRAGPTLENALAVLAGYDRDYPSARHRLVSVAPNGAVTVIQEGSANAEV
jgi:hypothetical protein